MKFCPECGEKIKEGEKFCSGCGNALTKTAKAKKKTENTAENIKKELNDVVDSTKDFKKADIEKNKGVSILSYFGILALIPFLGFKDSKFAQYHGKQGMNLFIVWVAYLVVYYFLTGLIKTEKSLGTMYGFDLGTVSVTPWWLSFILGLVALGITALAIMGIVYVCQGKAKELPIINKIKIFK